MRVFKTKDEKKSTETETTDAQTAIGGKKTYLPSGESPEEIKRREQIAARERAFYDAKHAAEDIADRNYRRARSDEQFRKADDELTAISIDIFKAEIKAGDSKADDELYRRQSELQELRRKALKRLGLTESDLEVPDEYKGDARGSPSSGGV